MSSVISHPDALPSVRETANQLTIGFWPDYSQDNPYQRLFYDSLAPYGFQATSDVQFNANWLADNPDHLQVVHIHWPEKLWNSSKRIRDQLRMIRARCEFLRACGRRGLLRVWTLHNWVPHTNGTWIDRIGNFAIALHSDLILVHSESIRKKVSRNWLLGHKTLVMPSGNYFGVYPKAKPASEVRLSLGLEASRPTCCMLGHLRRNKGIAELVQVVEHLGDGYQWIIAGHVDDPSTDVLLDQIRNRENVCVMDRRIDDQQLSDYAGASDCFVLPYHQSTGSGALLAALSFGRAVVASKLSAFTDLFPKHSDAAVFVRPRDVKSLAKGIEAFFASNVPQRQEAARDLCQRYRWDKVIQPVAKRLLDETQRLSARHSKDS